MHRQPGVSTIEAVPHLGDDHAEGVPAPLAHRDRHEHRKRLSVIGLEGSLDVSDVGELAECLRIRRCNCGVLGGDPARSLVDNDRGSLVAVAEPLQLRHRLGRLRAVGNPRRLVVVLGGGELARKGRGKRHQREPEDDRDPFRRTARECTGYLSVHEFPSTEAPSGANVPRKGEDRQPG